MIVACDVCGAFADLDITPSWFCRMNKICPDCLSMGALYVPKAKEAEQMLKAREEQES